MRWSWVLLCAASVVLPIGWAGCDNEAPPAATPAPQRPALFEDCTPLPGATPCQDGLRCGLVLVDEPPFQGMLTQCVPLAASGLREDQPCSLTERLPTSMSGSDKRFDGCAPGLGCVPTPDKGSLCRTLCALRKHGGCGSGRLCVLPSPVSSVGYCAAPSGCKPLAQTGCAAGIDGQKLSCYVLADDRQGGAYCLRQEPLGGAPGALDDVCERSVNCAGGLSCVNTGGVGSVCRPYCGLPADGGVPDGGVACRGDLGMCQPVSGYNGLGRCY